MSIDLTTEQEEFRLSAREWLAAHSPGRLPSMDTAAGAAAHRQWERTLADGRWSVVAWPEEFGGRNAGITEWVLFEEEYYLSGAPTRIAHNGISLLAPIIFEHGTPQQQQRYLPPMSDGTEIWAQAWSEPEAGSDLAGIRSRAVRDDARGGWLLSGQKTWSSRSPWADRGFGLFRTDPAAERHRGLTYFLFPLDAPGLTVRPITQLDGVDGFGEIFFDEVFVPDCDVLGGEGDGWRVAMSTAGNERGLSLRSPGRFRASATRLLELWRKRGSDVPEAGPGVVDAWIQAEAYRLYTWATVDHIEAGGSVGAQGSVNKLFWSAMDLSLEQTALQLLDSDQDLRAPGSPGAEHWADDYLFALAGPIYAGTNEVQRNIVAERILGLPREGTTRTTS
jgi:alkylation response protein AidB-like acyl-CoA dehydrogenase